MHGEYNVKHCVYISTHYALHTLILDMYAYIVQFTVHNPSLLYFSNN
jgi:hypothetical protein